MGFPPAAFFYFKEQGAQAPPQCNSTTIRCKCKYIYSMTCPSSQRVTRACHHSAFNSKMVMEYGGKTRVKCEPRPWVFSMTGMIFAGSSMELVSSGALAFKVMDCPFCAT